MAVNLNFGDKHDQMPVSSKLGTYYIFQCFVEGKTKEFYWQHREKYCPFCGEELPSNTERLERGSQ